MNESRTVAVLSGNGTITTQQEPIPEVEDGKVCIAVKSSLVSPGTELGGWDQLAKQRNEPALHPPKTFGYSASGIVTRVGNGVDTLQVGMRVVAVGAGYALHSDVIVVPQRLCVPLPHDVSHDAGSYAMLLATALQAVRRGSPAIGEYWLVVGLGLVGMLTAKLLQLSGCFVTGLDQHKFRTETFTSLVGEPAFLDTDGDLQKKLSDFSGNHGFDGAVIAFGGQADQAMDTVVGAMKVSPDGHPEGTIVTVGWPQFSYSGAIGSMNNIDLRRASRTGPGYHDGQWELGRDYPPVFVRWSTQSNIALCLELMRRKKIDVEAVTTHRIPLSEVDSGIQRGLQNPGRILGVIFQSE